MIKQKEYARRRLQLMRMTGPGAVIIVRCAAEKIRNNDVHYSYRQDSDFLYLSGFREPGSMMVLVPDDDQGRAIMFCRERDAKREMWDGPMHGLEGAVDEFGMDEAYPIAEAEERLPGILKSSERIYYDLGHDVDFDHKLIGWMNEFRANAHRNFHAPDEIIALDHILHDMRLFKSREELVAMRKSAKVAVEAHIRAMQVCRPGMNEAQIHAEILHTFTSNQCETSYLPIVGSGANACVLHYIANRDDMADGDLLLIDAGAEYDGYASDITRTFPVNGRFSGPQKDLYDVVLAAQEAAIARAIEGNAWDDVHEAAVEVVARGMLDLGLLEGSYEQTLDEETYGRFYVHKTGHWLGLDVHDVGDYQVDGHSRALERGMVFTVEPGVYIRPDDDSVAQQWRGLGIRIEDNIVVTKDEPEVITSGVPKTTHEIEALMSGG